MPIRAASMRRPSAVRSRAMRSMRSMAKLTSSGRASAGGVEPLLAEHQHALGARRDDRREERRDRDQPGAHDKDHYHMEAGRDSLAGVSWLSEKELDVLEAAVREAESRTSAELVV